MTYSVVRLSCILSIALATVCNGQYFPFHPSPFFMQPQQFMPFPYAHPAAVALQQRMSPAASQASPFAFNHFASPSQIAPVAVIPVPVPAMPFQMIPSNGQLSQAQSSSSSSQASSNSDSNSEISERSSTSKSSNERVASPFAGFSLKSLNLPNDFADKLFPFTIRIATHGEPHLPIMKVGHSPFTLGAGFWGKPELQYGKHVHHHPHQMPSPPQSW